MELELGLKITKNLDDICKFAKDRGASIFVSNETETMFVLTSHLRGYRMKNIKIDINEDATLITISGEKPIQEMVMKGLLMHKTEIEIKRFMKVFRIPRGVILDRIEAKFNEIDSILTIYMPKLNDGIIGGVIQEIEDEKIVEGLQDKQSNSDDEMHCKSRRHDEILENKTSVVFKNRKRGDKETSTSRETREGECSNTKYGVIQEMNSGKLVEGLQDKQSKSDDTTFACENRRNGDDKEASTSRETREGECSNTKDGDKIEEMHGNEEDSYDVRGTSDDQNEVERSDSKCSMLFGSCFFIGGAFIASLVVLVCSFVRLKRR